MSNLLNSEPAATGGIQLVGCTVRGPSHESAGDPSQDAWWGYQFADARFVAAVGDGLGSADRSDVGARLATRAAAETLAGHLTAGGSVTRDATEPVMRQAFTAARTRVERAASDLDRPVEDLHTTLLAVAAGPSGVAAGAVGDGGIVGDAGDEPFLLVPREETEYANVTTPVTSRRWETGYRFAFHDDAEAVALFTDGLSPFVWETGGPAAPRREFFDQVFDFVATASVRAEATRELCSFLDAEHFRTYSGDDKTLAVGRVEPAAIDGRLRIGRHTAGRLTDTLPDRLSTTPDREPPDGHRE